MRFRKKTEGGFCTHCGHEVSSFVGLNGCPACGSTGVPCAYRDQVDVSINWHELRILVIWAENYQRSLKEVGNRAVYAIARRLQAQHPDKPALSLAAEIGEIAKRYETSVTDPALRRDIAEQMGEETGLIRPGESPQ